MAPLRFELLLRFHAERGQVRLQVGEPPVHFRGARFGVFADTGCFHDILADLLRSRSQEWAAVFPEQIGQPADENREVDPEQDRFERGAETRFGFFLNFLRECRSRGYQARQQPPRSQVPFPGALHAARRRRMDSAIWLASVSLSCARPALAASTSSASAVLACRMARSDLARASAI